MIFRLLLIAIFLTSYVPIVRSQLNVTNILEVQLGKLPNEVSDAFPSVYNRGIINYRKGKFRSFLTIEQFYSKYDDRNYFDVSQIGLQYKSKQWDLKIGNFYETINRGILLRSYQIPGAILEDIGFRSRTYFHKDILGVSAKYSTKKFSIHLMRGDILNNVLPPTFSRTDRRSDLISSISAEIKYVKNHKVAISFMNHDRINQVDDNFVDLSLSGKISSGHNYYIEYASDFDQSDKYALYAGINGWINKIGYSIEYKKYHNFVLGTGINEPPALIKQHTYKVLNRSTHVTNPTNEEGYQLDLFYSLENGSTLSFNHALAINSFGTNSRIFQEYFLEWGSSIKEDTDYKIFMDYSKDPFKNQNNRISAGIYIDTKVDGKMRLLPEIEYQHFSRNGVGVNNQSYSLGWKLDSKFFVSFLLETSTDPFILDDDQSTRYYLGSNIRVKTNNKNTIQLFFGERRGGPLCSAGVCYEILDFKGMEARWSTRF